MARKRNPHEREWAQLVIDEVRDWGHAGQAFHDEKRAVVIVVGIGEVDLTDPDGQMSGWDPEHQHGVMRSRANRLLAEHFVVPTAWQTDDDDLNRAIRRALLDVREYRNAPTAHEAVARLERLLDQPGWQERLAWAAAEYVRRGSEKRFDRSILIGALIWIELGRPDRAAEAAGVIMAAPDGSERDFAVVDATRLTALCLATQLRDGRAATAALLGRRPNFDGNSLAEAFVLAAVAAENGLADELGAQHERIQLMLRKHEREVGPYAFNDGHEIRFIADTVASWVGQDSSMTSSDHPVAGNVAVVEPSFDVPGARQVEWRGDVAVAAGDSGEVAVTVDGQPTLAPPVRPEPSYGAVRIDTDRVVIDRPDGVTFELRYGWPEEIDELGELFVAWSPDGGRLVVHGEYGRFHVFAADGSWEGDYNDHWKDPNIGCVLSGDHLASWAWDGRVVVYDLARRLALTAIDFDAWADDALLVADGSVVIVDVNGGWFAHTADDGERIGPVRPAIGAAVHPTLPIAAYVDGHSFWIERYGHA